MEEKYALAYKHMRKAKEAKRKEDARNDLGLGPEDYEDGRPVEEDKNND